MSTKEVAQLLAIVDQAYNKASWHGTNLRGSVRRVSPAQALWRPHSGRHNIWEIVAHCAYWKYAAGLRFTAGARGSFRYKGSNWFKAPPTLTDRAWKDAVETLDEMHTTLRSAIAGLSNADLRKTPAGKKVTNFTLLSGIAAHDLYHAGQIQLLKRLSQDAL